MKTYKIIGLAVGALVAGTVAALSIFNPRNYADTRGNADDSDLRTRRYSVFKKFSTENNDVETIRFVVREVELCLARQKTYGRSWRVINSKVENASATVQAEVPIIIFTDDLRVTMNFESAKNGDSTKMEVVVNMHSASRIGKSDLGENQRHIAQLLKNLDFAFGNDQP